MSERNLPYLNLDSTDSIFFNRELEHVKSQAYDVRYVEGNFRKILPISSEASDGDSTIVYQGYDSRGIAKIISAYADDLPRAEISGIEKVARIKDLGASFAYNDKEIRNARRAGKPLTERKSIACKRAIEEKHNKIAFNGDDQHGLFGLFNNPNIPRTVISTTFMNDTAANVLASLHNSVNNMIATTNGLEIPNMILMPFVQFNYISSTAYNTTDSRSILDVFVQNNPYINNKAMVMALPEAKGAGTNGSDAMVIYRKDPMCLTYEIPMEMLFKPVQERNLEYVTNAVASTAGVLVYYPLSIMIVEGI